VLKIQVVEFNEIPFYDVPNQYVAQPAVSENQHTQNNICSTFNVDSTSNAMEIISVVLQMKCEDRQEDKFPSDIHFKHFMQRIY
jgi:hypothetical protein